MKGIRTGIVLGAGASFCYENGNSNIPSQENIVGRLFVGIDSSSDQAVPDFIGPSGLKHSRRLGLYLRRKFDIPQNQQASWAEADFWTVLQKRGFTLETLYAELEDDLSEREWLLQDFEALVRTAIMEPVNNRRKEVVCSYHRTLSEMLEPGDCVIDFNWDTLMADALLYHSHFWFPTTGFGLADVVPWMRPTQKAHPVQSLVQLFHVHGSFALFELEGSAKDGQPGWPLYLGPNTHTVGNSLLALSGIDTKDFKEKGEASATKKSREEDRRRVYGGHIYHQGKWFRPIFVPPSRHKKQYDHWYASRMRQNIHIRLPSIQQWIIAGYSFPDTDQEHLSQLFVNEVMNRRSNLKIVNISNHDGGFRERVHRTFPMFKEKDIDYSVVDFRELCKNLAR